MIRRLRRRHRHMVSMAAVAAPVLLLVALADRKPVVTDNTPLLAATGPAARSADLRASRSLAVGDAHLTVALHDDGDARYLSFARKDRNSRTGPDVLLYAQSQPDAGLAADAVLLGPLPLLASTRVVAPEPSAHLVFYSLAQHSVLATLPLEALQ